MRYLLDRAAPENSLLVELVFFDFVVSIVAEMLLSHLLLNPDSNPMGFKKNTVLDLYGVTCRMMIKSFLKRLWSRTIQICD